MVAQEGVCSSPRSRPILCLPALLLLPGVAWASRDSDDIKGLASLMNETQWQAQEQPFSPLQADHENEKEERAGTPEQQEEAAATVQANPEDVAVVVHALGRMKEVKAHSMPLPASAFVRMLAVADAGSGTFSLSASELVGSVLRKVQTYFQGTGVVKGVLNFIHETQKAVKAAGHALTFVSWAGLLAGGVNLVETYDKYEKESKPGGNTCLKTVLGASIGISVLGLGTGVVGMFCPVVGFVGSALGLVWNFISEGLKQWCKSKDDDYEIPVSLSQEQAKRMEEVGLGNGVSPSAVIQKQLADAVTMHVACDVREPFWDRKETREWWNVNKLAQQPKTENTCLQRKSTLPQITFTYSDPQCPKGR